MSKDTKILIVDDKPENLFALEHLIDEMNLGCSVMKAQSGQQALKQIQQDEFALVLLDIMMLGMDGYEVAKHIRETHQKDVLPIIFITAHTGPKPLDKFMAAGAVGSLEKPIDPEVLKRKLSLFLSIYKQRQKKQAA